MKTCPLCGAKVVYEGLMSFECEGNGCPNNLGAVLPSPIVPTPHQWWDALLRQYAAKNVYITPSFTDFTVAEFVAQAELVPGGHAAKQTEKFMAICAEYSVDKYMSGESVLRWTLLFRF